MNLCIDIGNTKVKFGISNLEGKLETFLKTSNLTIAFLKTILLEYSIKQAIVSSVRVKDEAVLSFLEKELETVLILSSAIRIPIESQYQTPKTLGNDRLAVVVAATVLYPGQQVLVVDAGTCITYDFITKDAVYMGGNILPGINMRFKALHELTAKLPLIEQDVLETFIGTSTKTSIQTGIMQGVLHELRGFRSQYEHQFGNIQVIVTGGDASYFESQLKSEIFALPNLVLIGLNKILNYNTQ